MTDICSEVEYYSNLLFNSLCKSSWDGQISSNNQQPICTTWTSLIILHGFHINFFALQGFQKIIEVRYGRHGNLWRKRNVIADRQGGQRHVVLHGGVVLGSVAMYKEKVALFQTAFARIVDLRPRGQLV